MKKAIAANPRHERPAMPSAPQTRAPRALQGEGLRFERVERRVMIMNGISRQLIGLWEEGRCLPGKKMALKIHNLTGRPLIELLYGPHGPMAEPQGIAFGK